MTKDEYTRKEIFDALNKPFENVSVRQDPGTRNEKWNYIPHARVTRRLNSALGFNWKSTVEPVKDFSTDKVLTVLLTLTVVIDGKEISRSQFGEADIHAGASIGNAAKIAASDGLKKAASLFGVGLQVWDKEEEQYSRRYSDQRNDQGTGFRSQNQNNQQQNNQQNRQQNQQQNNGSQKPMSKSQHNYLCKLAADKDMPKKNRDTLLEHITNHESEKVLISAQLAGKMINQAKEYIRNNQANGQTKPADTNTGQPREEDQEFNYAGELPF